MLDGRKKERNHLIVEQENQKRKENWFFAEMSLPYHKGQHTTD